MFRVAPSLVTPEIGDRVFTFINGQRVEGVLVCTSGMGLTPIDLFNDILITESDLRSFLWQNNVTKCSENLPGLIIQARVKIHLEV